jgi:hypothetical protein
MPRTPEAELPATTGDIDDLQADVATLTGVVGATLKAAITSPLGAFGELVTAVLSPRAQIDATYGLLVTDHITSSVGSGAVSNGNSVFAASTGVDANGAAQIATRRELRYMPGEGCRVRITAAFTPGVAGSNQFAGAFSESEALGFYTQDEVPGILRRIAGAQEILTLTVTAAAGGAENFTVRLSGVNYTITSGGALATTALVAQRIADRWPAAIGIATWECRSVGATVIFVATGCAASGGTNTFSSSGTATGTIAVTQAGAANDDVTGFTPQTAWNVDRMDGSGGAFNASGVTLSDTGTPSATLLRRDRLNVLEVVYPYLGVGTIQYKIMTSPGVFTLVHAIQYPGSSLIPTMRNPTLRMGWWVRNTGNTSNVVVRGICAAGFVEGVILSPREPFGCENPAFAGGSTEYAALLVRVGATFAGQVNRRELTHLHVSAGTDSANRLGSLRVVLNPTSVSGPINWQAIDATRSSVEYATTTTGVITGGQAVGYSIIGSQSGMLLSLEESDTRVAPGDVIAVGIKTVGGAANFIVQAMTSEN